MDEPSATPAADDREVLVLISDGRLRHRIGASLERSGYRVGRPERLLDWVRAREPHVLLVTDDGERAGEARAFVARLTPDAASVVLVHDPTPQTFRRLIATCTAVLPSSAADEDVLLAVAGAWRALSCLPAAAARALSGAEPGLPEVRVSARDAAWLRALADGATVAGLARASGYSQREMYRLLAALYGRLGTDSRTEALLRADRLGLLDAPPAAPPAAPPGAAAAARPTSGART